MSKNGGMPLSRLVFPVDPIGDPRMVSWLNHCCLFLTLVQGFSERSQQKNGGEDNWVGSSQSDGYFDLKKNAVLPRGFEIG